MYLNLFLIVGEGWGFYINNKFKTYDILSNEFICLPGIYQLMWIKLKSGQGRDKIIGNIYRLITAPCEDLSLAISTHVSTI